MKRIATLSGLVIVIGASGWATTRLTGTCGSSPNAGANAFRTEVAAAHAAAASGDACASDHAAAAGDVAAATTGDACASDHGAALGQFDPVMSGVCRFSCATKEKVDEASLVAQPGAKTGDLTRCPVSGVVFAVDDGRPAVHLASGDYVVCCGECAGKLAKHPERFLKL